MSNILMISMSVEPTVLIVDDFFRSFSETYKCGFRRILTKKITKEDLNWCDILIAIRTQNDFEASIAQIAKKMGKFCILSIDDDFFELEHHSIRRPLQEKALLRMLKCVDAVMSSNDTLGKRMCSRGNTDRFIRIDTVVKEQELHMQRHGAGEKLRVVYYMSDGTTTAFDAVIQPSLPSLYKEFGDKLHWTFMTVSPDMKEIFPEENVSREPSMSLEEFRCFLREGEFDIGIAPLENTTFSNAKYINKFMEYSTAGIPCIYSAVEPYTGFIRDGETGVLAKNSTEEWLAAFKRMSNLDFRVKCVENAQRQIKDQFSPEVLFARLAQDCPEITNFSAPKNQQARGLIWARVRASILTIADPFLRIRGRWKLEGFGSVCRWTWQHYIRRNDGK